MSKVQQAQAAFIPNVGCRDPGSWKCINSERLLLNVCNHVLFLCIVLASLFYFVILPNSQKSLDAQLRNAMNKLGNAFVDTLGDKSKISDNMKKTLVGAQKALLCLDDPYSKANNTLIFESLLQGLLAIIFVYLVVMILTNKWAEALSVLIENIASFTIIAGIEAVFFVLFASDFVAAGLENNPDEVQLEILEKLNDALKEIEKEKPANVTMFTNCK